MQERARFTSELPAPSAELVIIRTGFQAVIRALGRKKGERFLAEWASILADEDAVRMLFPARSSGDRAAVLVAQKQAIAWLAQAMPTFRATIPKG